MRRFAELRLILLLAAILAGAALLGRAFAPRGVSRDPRLSTRLTGPNGASAFRAALGRLGVDVSERRTPLFDLARGGPPDPRVVLAILQPSGRLTLPERQAVRDWVGRGGHLLAAGETGLVECFGYARVQTDSARVRPWGIDVDTTAARSNQVPAPHAVLRRHSPGLSRDSDETPGSSEGCAPYLAASVERMWFASPDPGAVRLSFRSGGEVLLVADARVFGNGILRWTDAGPMVMEWVLAGHPRAVIVDEYHQGFGRAASLPAAVLERTWRTPVGWALIQLAAAGALLLILGAIRFGPTVPGVQRRRRSPLEHLDALAAGLERSHASRTATLLIVNGLRRRLGGITGRTRGDAVAWLETLETGTRGAASRDAIQSLRRIARADAAGDDVMRAANAVEDVWETLKVPTRTRS